MPEKNRISNYFFIYLNFVRRRNEAQPQNMPHKFALGTCNFCRTSQGRRQFPGQQLCLSCGPRLRGACQGRRGQDILIVICGDSKSQNAWPTQRGAPKKKTWIQDTRYGRDSTVAQAVALPSSPSPSLSLFLAVAFIIMCVHNLHQGGNRLRSL